MAIKLDEMAKIIDGGSVHAHFARLMRRLDRNKSDIVAFAAFMASWRTQHGDVCLDLRDIAGKTVGEAFEGAITPAGDGVCDEKLPSFEKWIAHLKKSGVTGFPGQERPLVLDEQGRLYLFRYHEYQNIIAEGILRRAKTPFMRIDGDRMRRIADQLFPGAGGEIDRQRLAAIAAMRRRFTVISGGPGTGKTSTVVRILALIAREGISSSEAPLIALAAPTGKAAARLRDSIAMAMERFDFTDEEKAVIPAEAFTLHRLLGTIPGSPYFRRNAKNNLPYDLVVVDESSMADMALMAKLFMAMRDDASLIVVGDRDQLSSVESGAVLGDICDTGTRHTYSHGFMEDAGVETEANGKTMEREGEESPLADTLVVFERNYRFGPTSGIGALCSAVREGNVGLAIDILRSEKYGNVALHEPGSGVTFESWLRERICAGYAPLERAESPEQALAVLTTFSVLCALRKGPLGSESVNSIARRVLSKGGAGPARTAWHHGQPLIVSRNSYALGLFNGDVGVAFRTDENSLRAYFPSAGGGLRSFMPSRLPECELSYAITVHRSQGSEYDMALVVLPESMSPVLSRELLYTAVTRAKSRVEIWGSAEIVKEMVHRPMERRSGLRDALWGRYDGP